MQTAEQQAQALLDQTGGSAAPRIDYFVSATLDLAGNGRQTVRLADGLVVTAENSTGLGLRLSLNASLSTDAGSASPLALLPRRETTVPAAPGAAPEEA